MKSPEREIIYWGKYLFERRLVSGWGGNISCRLGKDHFLITGQHAPLGFLTPENLVEIDGKGRPLKKKQRPSSETSLHLAIYRGHEAKAIIHTHPPMVLAFSLTHRSFVPLSFEEKYTIGEVPILPQQTPTVTETEKVVKELRLRPVVILQGHGTVAVGKDLREAFLLTDLLEEAVHCQFFKEERESARPEPPSQSPQSQKGEGYLLFSREHMAALLAGANADPQFLDQGDQTRLTTTMTLQMEDADRRWTFHFQQGKISRLEEDGAGEFVISGNREWWAAIFQGEIDPFLAMQQGKLQLKGGELWQLSQWFKPFQRAFTLWRTIPIKPASSSARS